MPPKNQGKQQLDALLQSFGTQDADIVEPEFISPASPRLLEESRAKRFGTASNLNERAGKQAKAGNIGDGEERSRVSTRSSGKF